MSSTDYYEIHMELVHAISSVWEVWLAVTFATIVAFHVGRESVTRVLLAIGSTLYFGAAFVAIVRYGNYIESVALLRQEAVEAGLQAFPQDIDSSVLISILTVATMGFGTIATIGFAIYQYKLAQTKN